MIEITKYNDIHDPKTGRFASKSGGSANNVQPAKHDAKSPKFAGAKKGKEMEHEQADSGHCNPNYGEEGYDANCQSCVIAYEARRRGYDVEALPYIPKDEVTVDDTYYVQSVIGRNGEEAFLNASYKTEKITRETVDELYDDMKTQMQDDGRYQIAVTYIYGNSFSCHVVCGEKNNGKVRIYDPQRNLTWENDDSIKKDFMKEISTNDFYVNFYGNLVPVDGGVRMLRVDELKFSDLAEKVCKNSKK